MIQLAVPEPLLWALRWALFLGPLFATLLVSRAYRDLPRSLVGGLFAFLFGFAMIFATHQLALAAGWWRYGGDVLMVMGIPADIWLGGAMLFGPLLALGLPGIRPLALLLPIVILLHGTLFSSLRPLVEAGPNWFGGVLLVFAVAHLPAICLARWTAADENLPLRAALLAAAYGVLAFYVLPSLIMHAMGGTWTFGDRPTWLLAVCSFGFVMCVVMGLSAVQMFVVHGEGTPIPLDHTRRLVVTGLFAYVTNPMQLSTALAWIFLGAALGNWWVASASIMAWVFVAGMVRWHHRHDLLVRFPEGWPTYRANVAEWQPRWRPWVPEPATLMLSLDEPAHRRLRAWLVARHPVGLTIESSADAGLAYREPSEARRFCGPEAIAKSLNHLDLRWAFVGASMLLLLLPFGYVTSRCRIPLPLRRSRT